MKKDKDKIDPYHDHLTGRSMESLTAKEMMYYKMMKPKAGVLYVTGPPGLAKSAISESIAKKMGFRYHDLRLSQIDETDVGLYPKVKTGMYEYDDGFGNREKCEMDFLRHVIPEWALAANEVPTIIHFEELNRAPLAVRNAALQILNERRLGMKFKFNDKVLMISSGNLGEDDGTDVEEFDKALNNRLIHVKHSLDIDEWIEGFAGEHVHPAIVSFLKANTEHYHRPNDDSNHAAYATPRSWTNLSEFIYENHGGRDENGKIVRHPQVREFIEDIRALGHCYVGGSNVRFMRYLDESLKFTILDVLDRYEEIREELETFNRDKKSELLNALRDMKLVDMKDEQMENVKRFVLSISEDETVSYLLKVIDDEYQLMEENTDENSIAENFLTDKRFKKFHKAIIAHCEGE